MEQKDVQHTDNQPHSEIDKLKQNLDPGMQDRNLLSNQRQEAPIDKDLPTSANMETEEGDETYMDEEMDDPDYFEKRAGDNVRK